MLHDAPVISKHQTPKKFVLITHENKAEQHKFWSSVPAAVNCEWSSWSQWSQCSASCGSGQQASTRVVLQHSRYGGAPCEGPNQRIRTCVAPDCGESRRSS